MDVTLRKQDLVDSSHHLLGDLPLCYEQVMARPCRGDTLTMQRAVEPSRAYSGGSQRCAPVATLRRPVHLLTPNTVEPPDCPSQCLDLHRGRLAVAMTPHQRTYDTTLCVTKSDSGSPETRRQHHQ